MARRLRKLIKWFPFEETFRKDITLGPDVRLNPRRNRLELKATADQFPTTPDLFAKTRVTTPARVKNYIGFFVILRNKKVGTTQVTDVLFRLGNGTQEFYFNPGASAWIPASPNNWNTEQEVADNIASFPGQSLQVIINLSTQDPTLSPEVDEVRVLYEADLDSFQEEYVVRSFIEDLREQIRPIAEYAIESDGGTIDLGNIETPYNIVDVDSAYDDTADPAHLVDLEPTFDPGTKIVTLGTTAPLGNTVLLRFVYKPEVALTTSQDFTELAKVPVIVLDDVTLTNKTRVRPRPYVINKGTAQGFALEEGYQADIQIPLRLITDKAKDLDRLAGEVKRYFANTRLIRSRGQDDLFALTIIEPFDNVTTASQKEIHAGRLLATIRHAVFYPEDAKPITGVKRFKVTGGNIEVEVTS